MAPFLLLLIFVSTTICGAGATRDIRAPYINICPPPCYQTGTNSAQWTRYRQLKELAPSCDQGIVLFNFQLHTALSAGSFSNIRACTASVRDHFDYVDVVPEETSISYEKGSTFSTVSNSCGATIQKVKLKPQVGTADQPSQTGNSTGQQISEVNLTHLVDTLLVYVHAEPCGTSVLFAKSGGLVMGLFVWSEVTKRSASYLLEQVKAMTIDDWSLSLQVCHKNAATSDTHTVGIYVTMFDNLGSMQAAVRTWASGDCLVNKGQLSSIPATDMEVLVSRYEETSENQAPLGKRHHHSRLHSLVSRGDCRAVQVHSGDSCASLASTCKISSADLARYNKNPKLCSTLKSSQWICCTAGKLPDMRPKPGKDDVCYTYTVKQKDTCYSIGDPWQLKAADIEGFNKKTWGWTGCRYLQLGQKLCLSSGAPPMRAPLPGAICGPQVPGTKKPDPGKSLSSLNPCPLNACCDVFGYCGTTEEFCTNTSSPTGAPGTAKPGTSRCIQNCGTKIVNNEKSPSQFLRIGYYEALNSQRSCLNMNVNSIDTSNYTHIHFAFATVNTRFEPGILDSPIQFGKFTKLKGVKRVLSFGGWAFSTDQKTFQMFRQATDASHRQTFVNNLVQFMKTHSLDGYDFDWEYPGAPDIPNTTPGSSDEGQDYLEFLTLLRKQLPSDKSISIAIPSSYWYLKSYPISKIASVVDYLVYMSYDLHGQWDVGNKWTETYNALAMVTKAGVPSIKLVIGVTSYGRGFRMTKRTCSGPMCTYQGSSNASAAYSGRCTNTTGCISNAEIRELIDDPEPFDITRSYDKESDSDIVIYGKDNKYDWVAYMDETTKDNRIRWYQSLNFAGFSDWAIDLEYYTGDLPGDENTEPLIVEVDWDYIQMLACDSSDNPGDLQKLVDNLDNIPGICHDKYLVDILASMLNDALTEFHAVADSHYDDQFKHYADWIKYGINDQLQSFMAYGSGPGNKYFDCDYSYGRTTKSSSCAGMDHFWELSYNSDVTYHLKDKDGFFGELASKYGIQQEWVKFGDAKDAGGCDDDSVTDDSVTDDSVTDDKRTPGTSTGTHPCRKIKHEKHNFPQRIDGDKVHVGDPKKVIEASMGNITNLQNVLAASSVSLGLHTYKRPGDTNLSTHDPANAASMPVLQLISSVENMREIKKIGQKAIDAERKNLILLILSVVLLVIPFVGEELGPLVGSTIQVARIATIIGEAGNAAVTVAEIVEDPLSAPFAVSGLLGGVGTTERGAEKVAEAIGEASKVRKALTKEKLSKFPQSFRDKDALVQKVIKACPKS